MKKEYNFSAITHHDIPGTEGSHNLGPLDSGITGCRWHRLVLAGDIPAGSRITMQYYSSNTLSSDIHTKPELFESLVFTGSKDGLFNISGNDKTGRYLYLIMTVEHDAVGTSQSGPVIHEIRAYYQRLSYLRYLPGFIQSDKKRRHFMERFLSLFESSLYENEELIAHTAPFFDPQSAPDRFIPWLAEWMALDLYELLESKNRDFILKAPEFYKNKGTVKGLAQVVEFLTGFKCRIKEYYNNICRSYGMEHRGIAGKKISAGTYSYGYQRQMTKTFDPDDTWAAANIQSYFDETHYTFDGRPEGVYAPNVIELFIFAPSEEEFDVDESELLKIVNSYLPVFVRAKLRVIYKDYEYYDTGRITDTLADTVSDGTQESPPAHTGMFKSTMPWTSFTSYATSDGTGENTTKSIDFTGNVVKNDKQRTIHDENDTWIDINK